ncbi:MAG: asparagine synthase (glutamine-hydrolyzing) [Nitrospirae bacterium]|nr:asparagine synthase (glutamine-hydrolyzing) [Nitrospirota bacterium]
MCGIVGIYNLDGEPISSPLLEAMTQTLAHRGPDGQGIWVENNVGFGHRRLAIIDLETGIQPMQDCGRRYVITFNGEIYNYQELRAILEKQGFPFQTKSDTEVILNAFACWGADCVKRLNGIFAFAIWDKHEKSLFLARDHLGIKPLLYYTDAHRLIFSSDLESILQHPDVSTRINLYALSDYLSLGYILSPKTIFQNISKLPPATWMLWKGGQCSTQRYWDLASVVNDSGTRSVSEQQATDELQEGLERTVRMQLVSDVPLGAFLSGGVDSSTIVQMMSANSTISVKTFSIGFPQKSYSELPFARKVSNHLGTQHFDEVISPDIESLFPLLVRRYGEPFSDTSVIPTFLVSQLARRQVKVVLSGDGGDECFAGYDTYIADRIHSFYNHLPSFAHQLFFLPFAKLLPSTHHKVSWDYKLKQFIMQARCQPEEAHYRWRLMFTEDEKRHLLGEEVYRQLDHYTPFDSFLAFYNEVPQASFLHRSLYVDMKTWLADAMLVKVDRASMANGLEVRVPFLDWQFVEMAFSLPAYLKLRGIQTKYILKRVAERTLPRSVVYRSKRGFNSPVSRWILAVPQRMLKNMSSDIMPNAADMWRHLMQQHVARRADNGFKLWTLLFWSQWSREFLV